VPGRAVATGGDRCHHPTRGKEALVTKLARRAVAVTAVATLLGAAASACTSSSGGAFTLNFYNFPDNSGAVQQAADTCSKASGGQYKIKYQKLPTSADGQRQQLVRRLAAHDNSLDILGLDVTWAAEFSEAGWIREWTGDNKTKAEDGTLQIPLQTATWRGKLVAVPYNTNTQLLWYRADLVPTPPKTWAEMISDAQQLAKQGKPHYIEIQGAQYEGLTVWFNTLVSSAGGSILNADSTAPSLGQPAIDGVQVMRDLATSGTADPSLSNQMEDQNRLAMESGSAAFELNYPFVYPSMQQDKPDVKTFNGKSLAENFRWTAYPGVKEGTPSRVTIGGIDLAISSYSRHSDAAFQAALCLRNRDNQLVAAIKGGLPPTLQALYTQPTPDFIKNYPMYQAIYQSLQSASVRPQTPAYQSVSIVISHALSPPGKQNPSSVISSLHGQIDDALNSRGLIP
jgi:multiple sugar transport system substrate-binding protein